jgi:hypothetical protein
MIINRNTSVRHSPFLLAANNIGSNATDQAKAEALKELFPLLTYKPNLTLVREGVKKFNPNKEPVDDTEPVDGMNEDDRKRIFWSEAYFNELFEWNNKPPKFNHIRIFYTESFNLFLVDSKLYPNSLVAASTYYGCTCIGAKVYKNGNSYFGMNHIVSHKRTLEEEIKGLHQQLSEQFDKVQFFVRYYPEIYPGTDESILSEKYGVVSFRTPEPESKGDCIAVDNNSIYILEGSDELRQPDSSSPYGPYNYLVMNNKIPPIIIQWK